MIPEGFYSLRRRRILSTPKGKLHLSAYHKPLEIQEVQIYEPIAHQSGFYR